MVSNTQIQHKQISDKTTKHLTDGTLLFPTECTVNTSQITLQHTNPQKQFRSFKTYADE